MGALGWAGVLPFRCPGVAALTGMVWLPCSALMAACASAWEEYFTKAHPGWGGQERLSQGPEKARETRGLTGGAWEGPRGQDASKKKAEWV